MSQNVKTYQSDDAVLIVAREVKLNRTEIFLYIQVPPSKNVELAELATKKIDTTNSTSHDLPSGKMTDVEINDAYQTVFKYKYSNYPGLLIENPSGGYLQSDAFSYQNGDYIQYQGPPIPHWEYLDFFLLGVNHTILVETPNGSIIAGK